MSQTLIITGMHRSGTSFVAELFKGAGLHIGERLFPGDGGNPRGYFEDEDILTLQRTMIAKACPTGVVGWPDWGWTEAEKLNEDVWSDDEPAMRAMATQRERPKVWGWKDPRPPPPPCAHASAVRPAAHAPASTCRPRGCR